MIHRHGVWQGTTCGLGTETCPYDESIKDPVHNHGYDPSCIENWSFGRPRGACLGPFPVRPDDLESPSSTGVGPSATENVEGSQISDPVNNPSHYRWLPVEAIEITELFNFCMGNALKYILRADYKGKPVEDIRKAIWYLERELANRERDTP